MICIQKYSGTVSVQSVKPNSINAFLHINANGMVFRKKILVQKDGRIILNTRTNDGVLVKSICGLRGLSHLFIEIHEIEEGDGHKSKILFGWDNENTWGAIGQEKIKYKVAEQQGNVWHPLRTPIALEGLTKRQKSIQQTKILTELLKGNTHLSPLVCQWDIRKGIIIFQINGDHHEIYGFDGYLTVYSVVQVEQDQIVARFYPTEKERTPANQIKAVVMARNIKGIWDPLEIFEMISTRKECSFQSARITSQSLALFLTTEQPAGSVFDLEEKLVSKDGAVQITANKTLILCCGYTRYAGDKLAGAVFSLDGEKRAYFWVPGTDLSSPPPAILPAGHLLSAKKGSEWEIINEIAPPENRKKIDSSQRYSKYLFSTAGDKKTYQEPWFVRRATGNRCGWIARKGIRGERDVLWLPRSFTGTSVYSVTKELSGTIKLVEFWQDRFGFDNNENPFGARFITIWNTSGQWTHFWAALDNIGRFKALLRKGTITRETITRIVSNPYLYARYPRQNNLLWQTFI